MEDFKFKDLEDLYNRIFPALKSKVSEFKIKGYKYIKEIDIWNYLKTYKWETAQDLDLALMVDDILNVRVEDINNYIVSLRREDYAK